jgi:hypothetical protein
MACPKPQEAKMNSLMQSNLGDEVEVEVIPGTEFMNNVGNIQYVHAHSSGGSAVLIPPPTNNLDDPLVITLVSTKLAKVD